MPAERGSNGDPAIDALLKRALEEDRPSSDRTSEAVVPEGAGAVGVVRAKAGGVVAGLAFASRLVSLADPGLAAESLVAEGAPVVPGRAVFRVAGSARAVLRIERPLLNLLQHLSGVATLTARFVAAVRGTGVRISDTRKTLPGLRAAERHAVRAGGGEHHRESLSDAILVKENHVRALARTLPPGADAYGEAIARALAARAGARPVRVGIEAETVDEAVAAARAGADLVLLDDFSLEDLREAVRAVRALGTRPPVLEASGGVRLDTVRAIAETGVDRISIGALTHSAPALDLSLAVEEEGRP